MTIVRLLLYAESRAVEMNRSRGGREVVVVIVEMLHVAVACCCRTPETTAKGRDRELNDATLIDSSPKSAIVSLCSLVVSLLMFASVDESSIVGCWLLCVCVGIWLRPF
jgi:hypothetical protein